MIPSLKSLATFFALSACAVTVSHAQLFNATDRGFYDDSGAHDATNDGYFVGQFSGISARNFFTFDLSSASGTVLSAELRLFNPQEGFASNSASETFSIFDVSTDLASLTAGTAGGAAFADLGTGSLLGSASVTGAQQNTFINISLNATGLSYVQAALGQSVGFGGALTTLAGGDDQYLFAFSGGDFDMTQTQLVIRTAATAAIPEPSTYALVAAAGLVALTIRRRLRAV